MITSQFIRSKEIERALHARPRAFRRRGLSFFWWHTVPACETAQWRVAHPINELSGNDAALSKLWEPLKAAFPDLERRDTIFVGGSYEGRDFIAAVGHYCGTMRGDWLGIPATKKNVYIRCGEVWQIDADGRAIQAN
ncbi:MAG: hypothetical protein EOO81_04150, partial [Oxalobacteraceae bacterium]